MPFYKMPAGRAGNWPFAQMLRISAKCQKVLLHLLLVPMGGRNKFLPLSEEEEDRPKLVQLIIPDEQPCFDLTQISTRILQFYKCLFSSISLLFA